jgi:L-threonylcarbamoyladenylate synthase
VIVHLAPEADLAYWSPAIPAVARQLIARFWPGPLTLILARATRIPAAVSGGQDSIGLRCPAHPVAQALLRAFNNGHGGIAAPSANKFGRISPTTAQHVRDEFGAPQPQVAHGVLNAVLEGGASSVGIESTILDLSRHATLGPVLLRPGHISAAALAEVLGSWPQAPDQAAPRASGTLAAHYAPRTPLLLFERAQLPLLLPHLHARRFALIRCGAADSELDAALAGLALACASLPASASDYARQLYAALRQMDELGAELILLERPPTTDAWRAVNDRLRRAAHDSNGMLAGLLAAAAGAGPLPAR